MEQMTLKEFYAMLKGFDWYFEFSDDFRVWSAGNKRQKYLMEIAKSSPELQSLYNGFHAHYFSGGPWGTEQSQMPEMPA
jgi:hypothetical protein